MNRVFNSIVKYNKILSVSNLYNTNTYYSYGYFLINDA